jgi:ubiquinone biosynthesis accessory factor UbiK
MFDQDFLQQLSARAAGLFPAAAAKRKELEQELHGLLQSSLAKLQVVTREEFDAQRRVLEAAQAQLAALERKVAELEAGRQAGEQ